MLQFAGNLWTVTLHQNIRSVFSNRFYTYHVILILLSHLHQGNLERRWRCWSLLLRLLFPLWQVWFATSSANDWTKTIKRTTSLKVYAALRNRKPRRLPSPGFSLLKPFSFALPTASISYAEPNFKIPLPHFYFTFTSRTAIYGLDGMSIVNSPLWRPAGVMVMFQVSMTSTSNSWPSGMWNGRRHGRLAP